LVSSIYNPNLKLLKKYRNPSRFDVIDSKFIDLDSLDNALSDIGFRQDYIKLDIQGAELEVLKGSTQTLKNAFFVEVEVEFREIYLDQPLFGDVSKFLEDENFIFTDFLSTAKYYRQQNNYGGDLIFADALFMKDPTEINFDEDFDLESVNAYIFILFLTKKYDALKYIEEMSKKYSILCKFDCFFKVVNKIIHKENKLMRRMWNAL